MKGAYLFVVECFRDCTLEIGRLGRVSFKKGIYCYVGSSMTNLESRIKRHLEKNKKKKWHIDYLTINKNFDFYSCFLFSSDKKNECEISNLLNKNFSSIKGFGCSDCDCKSHLYFINKRFKFIKLISKII